MMQKIVDKVDLYGEKVGVTYKGQSTYNTKLGAFVSLLLLLLVSSYTITKAILMFERSDPIKQYFLESANIYMGE